MDYLIETFLLCVIAINAMNCTTIHPDLDQLIPYDGLNHLLKPSPVQYYTNLYSTLHNNNIIIIKVYNK